MVTIIHDIPFFACCCDLTSESSSPYRLKQGEQVLKCSVSFAPLSVGLNARDRSAESCGQPSRFGLGKASERYERANCSKCLSPFSMRRRSLTLILMVQNRFQFSDQASGRFFVAPD